jgi:hypothetical protein
MVIGEYRLFTKNMKNKGILAPLQTKNEIDNLTFL